MAKTKPKVSVIKRIGAEPPRDYLEYMGWTGGVLLALCGLPEAVVTIINGYCALSWGLLLMWGFGEIFVLVPIWYKVRKGWLVFNYTANIGFVSIMIFYKIFGAA